MPQTLSNVQDCVHIPKQRSRVHGCMDVVERARTEHFTPQTSQTGGKCATCCLRRGRDASFPSVIGICRRACCCSPPLTPTNCTEGHVPTHMHAASSKPPAPNPPCSQHQFQTYPIAYSDGHCCDQCFCFGFHKVSMQRNVDFLPPESRATTTLANHCARQSDLMSSKAVETSVLDNHGFQPISSPKNKIDARPMGRRVIKHLGCDSPA